MNDLASMINFPSLISCQHKIKNKRVYLSRNYGNTLFWISHKLFDMLNTIYPLMPVSVLSRCGYIF